MKKIITIPTLIGIFFLVAGIATGLILIQGSQTFRLGAAPQSAPKDVRISNITDSSFSVSWITDSSTNGFVKYGVSQGSLGSTVLDEISGSSETHFATVRGLTPATRYFFKINSGGEDFDSNGVAWSASTGAAIGTSESTIIISGNIESSAKTPAKNALVYAQIQGASVVSTFTSADGNWIVTLSQSRTLPALAAFAPIDVNQSVVEIFVQGASGGISTAKIRPVGAKPAPTITLGKVHDFTAVQADNSNTPKATLDLPTTTETNSKFIVSETAPPATSAVVTLESHKDGEVVTTTEPEFFGEGPPGTAITITVESDPVTETVKVGQNGDWSWEVPQNLEPGTHKLTIAWRDAQGILRTLTRSFIVSAAEGPAFESSSSATTATPTPTPSPTLTPKPSPAPAATVTPTPISTPTGSAVPIPESGTLTPTIVLFMMSIGLLLLSATVAFLAF